MYFSKGILSALDLISGDKLEFLLIIAPHESSYNLARATLEVAEKFNVLIKVCVIWHGDGNSVTNTEIMTSTALSSVGNYTDVVEVKNSPSCPSWWDLYQMSDKGAILVRPDEHIAWRAMSEIVDPICEMERVFSVVLGCA